MKKSFLTLVLTIILLAVLTVCAFAAYNTGDVNNDSKITPVDARLTLRYAVNLDTFTEEQIVAADVNKSGNVTTSDARMILRVAVGLDNFASVDELNAMLIEPGVLNVAVCADNPPFCYIENGTLKGVDVDVAEKLADSYGLELKLHNMAYDELVNSVKNNECDIVISRIENDERAEFDLVQQDLYLQLLKNLKLTNYVKFQLSYESTEEIKKDSSKKIGVLKDSIADVVITNDINNGELSASRIIRYSNYADAYNDLVNDKIFVFVDENELLFNYAMWGADEPYLNDNNIFFTTNEKSELLKKLTSSVSSTTIQQLIDTYCPPAISDSTIICETSSVTLAPGGTAVIEVSFDSFYGNDYLTIKSSPYNANLVEYADKYYLVICILPQSTSGEIVLDLNFENSVTHTIKVTVSKSSGAKYNYGTESYCPDLGAYSGVAPEEVVVDTENQAISYIYNAEKLYNAGMKDTDDYNKYLELMEKQGFVADSYMTDDYSYYILYLINEATGKEAAYAEYYYYDGTNLYLTAVAVIVAHNF